MSAVQDAFLFSAPGSALNNPSTARKVHLRRLYDVLQLSLHRNDITRARRAWSILIRCKEFDWLDMWGIAVHLVEEDEQQDEGKYNSTRKIELLRDMMLHYPDQRTSLLKELAFRLILAGYHRQALDELELYLPSFPYQDNPNLHVYAGLICFYLSQGESDSDNSLNPGLLREATVYFERAKTLDPDNDIAASFLHKIAVQNLESNIQGTGIGDSDDDERMVLDDVSSRLKRARKSIALP